MQTAGYNGVRMVHTMLQIAQFLSTQKICLSINNKVCPTIELSFFYYTFLTLRKIIKGDRELRPKITINKSRFIYQRLIRIAGGKEAII